VERAACDNWLRWSVQLAACENWLLWSVQLAALNRGGQRTAYVLGRSEANLERFRGRVPQVCGVSQCAWCHKKRVDKAVLKVSAAVKHSAFIRLPL
jgi:hypothetical protein